MGRHAGAGYRGLWSLSAAVASGRPRQRGGDRQRHIPFDRAAAARHYRAAGAKTGNLAERLCADAGSTAGRQRRAMRLRWCITNAAAPAPAKLPGERLEPTVLSFRASRRTFAHLAWSSLDDWNRMRREYGLTSMRPGGHTRKGIMLDVRQYQSNAHRTGCAPGAQGGQGPRSGQGPGRLGNDQECADQRRHRGADGQSDHAGLPAEGPDRARRPHGPGEPIARRVEIEYHHGRRGSRQGHHRNRRHPRHQERDRRRFGEGRSGQIDDGRGHRLRPAVLWRLGRTDGCRCLRPVHSSPGRCHGTPHGPG